MTVDHFHSGRPWESPETSGEGRLPMRSPLIPWPGAAEARAAADLGPRGGAPASPWVLALDGTWRFALAENPDAVPRGHGAEGSFASPGFDDSQWGELRVPGTWTLQGHDKPHYTNVVMPFGNVPPSAPASHNPTGLYRVGFHLPAAWSRRRVVLHVGGAESFLEAWCNGTRLGFSKDSRLPTEFDLTPFLRAGANLLAFAVIRYSDASFIEDQDQWWYGGIYRSVYLYSTEFAYLADVDARPALGDAGPSQSGSVEVAVRLGFTFDPAREVPVGTAPADYAASGGLPPGIETGEMHGDWEVRAALYGPGRLSAAGFGPSAVGPGLAADAPLATARSTVGASCRASRWEARMSLPVAAPAPWNHEDPALYTLVVTLVSPRGREVEHVACRLGFRRVEVKDRALLINGRPVLDQGREPGRARRAERQDPGCRGHGPGHRDHETSQLQRGPALALPQRRALVRPVRRVRPLPRRRGRHREPRLLRPSLPRSALGFGLPGTRHADGDPRQEPPLGRHLVAWERVGVWPEPRRPRRLAPLLRSFPPPALRGLLPARMGPGPARPRVDEARPPRHRHRVRDVSAH